MDWNEDGLNDLLVGENNGQVRYYRNIGTAGNPSLTYEGTLVVGGIAIDIGSYSQPWVDDWNEDGLKDLLVGASDGRVYLYINVGTNENPRFSTTQWVTLGTGAQVDFGSRSGPVVTDLNGDGAKDLVSGEISGYVYYCKNNGTNEAPVLASPVALATGTITIDHGSTSRFAIIDWDGDSTVDIVTGGYDSRLKRFMQTPATEPAPTMTLINNGGYSIPGTGGTLDFTFTANNQNNATVTFDAWTEVQLPDDSFYGPLIARTNLSLGPFGSLSRNLQQIVPGSAPPNYYYYYGYVGDQSELQVYSQDDFYFYKTGDGDGTGLGSWNCTGWEDEELCQPGQQMPERMNLSAAPNPFNPVTTLNFALPEAGRVNLNVYNLSGQRVASLVDGYRNAGNHEVTWDASGLPSGVYFVKVQTGAQQLVQKLLLTK